MKTKAFVYSLVLIISATACQTKTTENTSSIDSVANSNIQSNQQSKITENETEDFLIIKGKDIWVRDVPSTGKVVMKLNEGDKCKILEKGKLAAIKGRPDYWYQIEINQTQGWVFGSQTNLAFFKPIDQPFTGNLTVCDNPIITEIETPASFSYTFKKDKSFQFSVAAGYIIEGNYEWKENAIKLNKLNLIMDTPDGNSKTNLKGSITFAVFVKDQLICLNETENKLADKNYVPAAGCFCLGK